jgi:hypothetical protein
MLAVLTAADVDLDMEEVQEEVCVDGESEESGEEMDDIIDMEE